MRLTSILRTFLQIEDGAFVSRYTVHVYIILIYYPLSAYAASPSSMSGVHGLLPASASSTEGRPELGLAFNMASVSHSDISDYGTHSSHLVSTDNAPVAVFLHVVDRFCALFRPATVLAPDFTNG